MKRNLFSRAYLALALLPVIGISQTSYDLNSATPPVNGFEPTAIGRDALSLNFSSFIGGAENVAVGWEAMFTNDQGSYNVAVGSKALWANSISNNNTAIGAYALHNNNQNGNTAVGREAV